MGVSLPCIHSRSVDTVPRLLAGIKSDVTHTHFSVQGVFAQQYLKAGKSKFIV